jgi:Tol biopolymer transport system component
MLSPASLKKSSWTQGTHYKVVLGAVSSSSDEKSIEYKEIINTVRLPILIGGVARLTQNKLLAGFMNI